MEEIETSFGERVNKFCENKIFISSFIPFQYKCLPERLNPESKIHKSVICILEKHSLWKPFGNPLESVKDKEKDKVKEEDKVKESEKKERLLQSLKEGMIQTWQYLEQFPEPELEKDAIEVIKHLRKTKNITVPPEKKEINLLIRNWIFTDDPYMVTKEELIKMIDGAGSDDFEKDKLQVRYILNPDHKAKLLGMEEASKPKKRTTNESENKIRYPKNHGSRIEI